MNWHQAETAKSVEGRNIVLFLSHPDVKQSLDTLILGAFHGDEPESAQLTEAFLTGIAPEGIPVGVVPVVNPDGLFKGQRTNAHGVDLNRNFPTNDWVEQEQATPYYSGPTAGSEPETRFILELLDCYTPKKIISVHTPYKVINYDGPALALAQALSKIIGYPITEDIGYATPGSFGTYCGKERNMAVLTLELPEEGFDQTELNRNLEGLVAAINFPSPPREESNR